jgi:hypothetical protein
MITMIAIGIQKPDMGNIVAVRPDIPLIKGLAPVMNIVLAYSKFAPTLMLTVANISFAQPAMSPSFRFRLNSRILATSAKLSFLNRVSQSHSTC